MFLAVFGQRTQEEINGEAQAAGCRRLEQMQHAMQNSHVLVGGNNINAVLLYNHAVFHLEDFHFGNPLKQLGQHSFVSRIEMLHNNICHATVFRNIFQKQFYCLQSACRSAYPDYRKQGSIRIRSFYFWRFY